MSESMIRTFAGAVFEGYPPLSLSNWTAKVEDGLQLWVPDEQMFNAARISLRKSPGMRHMLEVSPMKNTKAFKEASEQLGEPDPTLALLIWLVSQHAGLT